MNIRKIDLFVIIIFIVLVLLYISIGTKLIRKELFAVTCAADGSLWAPSTAPDDTIVADISMCKEGKANVVVDNDNKTTITCNKDGFAWYPDGAQTPDIIRCFSGKGNPIFIRTPRPAEYNSKPPNQIINSLTQNENNYFFCNQNGISSRVKIKNGLEAVSTDGSNPADSCQAKRAHKYKINNVEKIYCDPYGKIYATAVADNGVVVDNVSGCKSGKAIRLITGEFQCDANGSVSIADGQEASDVSKCSSGRANPKTT